MFCDVVSFICLYRADGNVAYVSFPVKAVCGHHGHRILNQAEVSLWLKTIIHCFHASNWLLLSSRNTVAIFPFKPQKKFKQILKYRQKENAYWTAFPPNVYKQIKLYNITKHRDWRIEVQIWLIFSNSASFLLQVVVCRIFGQLNVVPLILRWHHSHMTYKVDSISFIFAIFSCRRYAKHGNSWKVTWHHSVHVTFLYCKNFQWSFTAFNLIQQKFIHLKKVYKLLSKFWKLYSIFAIYIKHFQFNMSKFT